MPSSHGRCRRRRTSARGRRGTAGWTRCRRAWVPSCQSSIRTHGQGVWLPAHVQGIECVDTVGGKTLFATAGVADPLPEAYGSAVEDFGVPLRNVEVPFTVVKDRHARWPDPCPSSGRPVCLCQGAVQRIGSGRDRRAGAVARGPGVRGRGVGCGATPPGGVRRRWCSPWARRSVSGRLLDADGRRGRRVARSGAKAGSSAHQGRGALGPARG